MNRSFFLPSTCPECYLETHNCDIRCRFFTCSNQKPSLLAIHGARSSLEAFDHLLNQLFVRKNIQSVSFDLSGHCLKQEENKESFSLRRNLSETKQVADLFGSSLKAVIGYSMGGAIAIKFAELCGDRIDMLVLICPAIYTERAYEVSFGDSLKREISRPFSFLNSSSYGFLKKFSGRILLIIGEYDGLRATEYGGHEGHSAGWVALSDGRAVYSPIPADVIQGIESAAKNKLTKVIIPGCDHFVLSALKANSLLANNVVERIYEFLQPQ